MEYLGDCTHSYHMLKNALTRYCPRCGEEVNNAISIKKCKNETHVFKRYSNNRFCDDCGQGLNFKAMTLNMKWS